MTELGIRNQYHTGGVSNPNDSIIFFFEIKIHVGSSVSQQVKLIKVFCCRIQQLGMFGAC